ncbi:aminoethylphosphonate catabolism associated LysR family transcriptional regulator [compost metagenome]
MAIGELRNHCLLMREAGSTTRQLTEAMLQQAGVVPASMLEIGSRESIREAVIRNLGVSLIARQAVPDNPELRVLEVQGAPLMDEYLYCLKDRRQARLPSAFLALARNADG